MKTVWFWQTKDIDNDYYSSSSEESTGHQNKIRYYHWNCRYAYKKSKENKNRQLN